MSEVVKRFYLIRYQAGKCTEETLEGLVTTGKLTEGEVNEIISSVQL